jgi:hypothetical protein
VTVGVSVGVGVTVGVALAVEVGVGVLTSLLASNAPIEQFVAPYPGR